MRIVIWFSLLAIILVHEGRAQKSIDKSGELWTVWEEAAKKLDGGRFDDAITLYQMYQPDFAYRLKQTQNLKNLFSEGLKLQKDRRYSEAIAMYKRHRDFNGVGSLGIFEKKIDECILLLGAPDNSRLRDLERRDLAAEYSYKADKKLLIMDTQGALKDYDLAKKYGNTASQNLREKYKNDLLMIQEIIQWQQLARQAEGKNLDEKKIAFEKYRDIKGVPVLPRIETNIQVVIAQMEGRNVLMVLAQNCETDALLQYVQEHRAEFTQSETLVSKLRQYKSIRNKIDTLSGRLNNSNTVQSAFASVESTTKTFVELPEEVKKSLETCLKNDKHRVFMGYSAMAAKDSNYTVAQIFLNEAKELRLPGKETEINILESLVNTQRSQNEKNKKDTEKKTKDNYKIKKELDYVKSLIEKGRCREARINIASIKRSILLNDEQAGKLAETEIALKACQSTELKVGIVASVSTNKPLYKINSDYHDMSYGLTTGAGIQVSVGKRNSSFSFPFSLEYFSTDYNSLSTDDQAIENFKINGASGSLNGKIKIRPTGKFYLKVGVEGLVPISYRYRNYSASIESTDKTHLNNIILSEHGGIGVDLGRWLIEGHASYGLNSIYNKTAKNGSATQNEQVNARFVRAGIRIGFWLL